MLERLQKEMEYKEEKLIEGVAELQKKHDKEMEALLNDGNSF